MENWREEVLLHFTDDPLDWWTVDDAMKGTSILGGTGSGKTSASGKALAKKFLEQGWGGLVLCAKNDEAELWEDYCREAGRHKDLIIFRKGAVHPEHTKYEGELMVFNPLHYEMNRIGQGAKEAQNITNIFMNIYRMGNRISGDGDTKEERFWDTALKRCLNRIIEIINYAGEELTYKNMVNVIFSAVNITDKRINKALDILKNEENGIDSEVDEDEEIEEEYEEDEVEQDEDDDETKEEKSNDKKVKKEEPPTKEKDYCLFCIAQALHNTRDKANNSIEVNTIELAYQYFSQTLPTMGEKTRTTIIESFMGLAEPFLSGLLSVHFSGITNIFPEQTFTENKVIILDFSVKEFLDAGIMAQCIFKLIFQQAIERRKVKEFPNPVFLWADEAQYFVNPYDQIFLTTARSSRAATVFLSQNISNYLVIMGAGENAKAKVDSFMGNLTTKIFHTNSDAETNEYASRLIGSDITYMNGQNVSSELYSLNINTTQSTSAQILPQIQPKYFTTLKSGGINNNFEVDALVFVSGKIWSDGKNFIETFFKQNFKNQ